jgi:hypothetical protein
LFIDAGSNSELRGDLVLEECERFALYSEQDARTPKTTIITYSSFRCYGVHLNRHVGVFHG